MNDPIKPQLEPDTCKRRIIIKVQGAQGHCCISAHDIAGISGRKVKNKALFKASKCATANAAAWVRLWARQGTNWWDSVRIRTSGSGEFIFREQLLTCCIIVFSAHWQKSNSRKVSVHCHI